MQDSKELSEARTQLSGAVLNFVRVYAQERGIEGDVFIMGWAGFAEYVTPDMVQADTSGNAILVPDDQHAATSRGLFEFGADAFSRSYR